MAVARLPMEVALEAALDFVDAPALFVDRSLRIRAWNQAAERALQFRRSDVLGAPCLGAVRSAPCMAGCPLLSEKNSEDPVEVFRKDGTAVTYQRVGRVVRDEQGEILGMIETLRPSPGPAPGAEVRFGALVSHAAPMQRVLEQARRIAATDAAVLVTGETGSGKRTLARELHARGRPQGPLVHVACSPTASLDWPALVASARGGTLFLDHVERLTPAQQAGLALHWPENSSPVVVSTAGPDLPDRVAEGTFERGLLYRVRVVHLQVPPLRERREDILPLARQIIEEVGGAELLSPEVETALLKHRWPGNVRELRGALRHAAAVGTLPDELARRPGMQVATTLAGDAELAARVRWAMERTNGHVGRAARLLGMSRSTFWRLRRDLGPLARSGS